MTASTDDVLVLQRELEAVMSELEELRRENQTRRVEILLVGRKRWVPLVVALVLAFVAGFAGIALFDSDHTYTRVICNY